MKLCLGRSTHLERLVNAAPSRPLTSDRHFTVDLADRARAAEKGEHTVVEVIAGDLVATTNSVSDIPGEHYGRNRHPYKDICHQRSNEGPRLDLVDASGDLVVLA